MVPFLCTTSEVMVPTYASFELLALFMESDHSSICLIWSDAICSLTLREPHSKVILQLEIFVYCYS